MSTKHRGKAAQTKYAAKMGEKISRARANYNPDAATREAERDHEWVLEQAAIRRPVGRPAVLPASHRLTVNLTADQIATAQRLGNGNASAGVRNALEIADTR